MRAAPSLFAFFCLGSLSFAATTFTEDFSSNTMGPNLVLGGGSGTDIDYSASNAHFTGTDSSSSQRAYLASGMAYDLGVNFVVDAVVTIPTATGGASDGPKVAFFGLGSGNRGDSSGSGGSPSYNEPSAGPSAYAAFFSAGGGLIATGDFDSTDTGGTAANIQTPTLGAGTHRLRMTYDATAGTVTFEFQEDGIGGYTALDPVTVSDNGFGASSSFFFGGAGGVVFDDISAVVIPEPGQAMLAALGLAGMALRRRRTATV